MNRSSERNVRRISSRMNVTVTVLLFAAIGCDKTPATGTVNRDYIKGVYSLPLTLDPALMNDTASLMTSHLIYSGLVAFGPTLEIRPELAKSWSTSKDGKTMTFDLREGARFQNGEMITADDVVRSLKRVISRESKVSTYYECIQGADRFHEGRSNRLDGVRSVGKSRVEIKLKYPFPPFLSILAGATAAILPKDASRPDFFDKPVGAGPFEFERKTTYEGNNAVVLVRSKNYFGETPKIERLVLREANEKQALNLASAGKMDDLANFPLTGGEEVFKGGLHLEGPLAATWIIGLNSRIAPFNDPEVRRAFKKSLDAEGFREKFYPDALPAYGYIPSGLPGFRRVREPEGNEIASPPIVSQVPIKITIPAVLARSGEMKTFLERSLRERGWNVNVELAEWNVLMKGYSGKTLQSFLVSMNMDYPDTEFLVRNFESSNSDNFSGLKNFEVDALIRKARGAEDRVIRQSLYEELVTKLDKEAVTVNLLHPRGHYWFSKCVRGVEPNILGDVYIDYRTISLDRKCDGKTEARI